MVVSTKVKFKSLIHSAIFLEALLDKIMIKNTPPPLIVLSFKGLEREGRGKKGGRMTIKEEGEGLKCYFRLFNSFFRVLCLLNNNKQFYLTKIIMNLQIYKTKKHLPPSFKFVVQLRKKNLT